MITMEIKFIAARGVSSAARTFDLILALIIVGAHRLFSSLHLVLSVYLALVEMGQADDISNQTETAKLNADNLTVLQLQFASEDDGAMAMRSPHRHTAADGTNLARSYDEVEDTIEVLSEATTAHDDSSVYEATYPFSLPYPLPLSGLEWFELITGSVAFGRLVSCKEEKMFGPLTTRFMQWDEVYNRFDFSSSQVIDMAIDVRQQSVTARRRMAICHD